MHVHTRHFFPLLYILLLAGCAAGITAVQQNQPHHLRVYYATDRNFNLKAANPSEHYGTDRGSISYGRCDVTIPPVHSISELESPSFFESDRGNPGRHVIITAIEQRDENVFFKELADRVTASRVPHLLIYIHGYYMTFEDAARRMAQIAFDIDFNGAPVFYSWPSRDSVTKYTDDEVNVEWTQPHLKKFLETAANKSGASEIFLVAHSMGNRVLTKALIELLDDNPELKKRFKALVLAAPDIDAEIFRRDIAPKLTAAGLFVTLYASCEDKALHLSKNLHGYIRAGDNSEGVCVVPGVEIIDATNLDSGFLGHSYYNESRSVLSDLYYLINRGLRANERFSLEPVDTPSGRYWRFRK